MSSIFEECIIVFQVLGQNVRIPCIFHGILMVKSNESNTSAHFHVERNFFFSVLDPPDLENIEQALLSYLFAHLHLLSSDLISSDSSPF